MVSTLALAVSSVGASSASAAQVVAFGGGVNIVVDMGAKNYANHTQFVNSIYVETPGHCDGGTVEAWTSGWYASRQMCGYAYFTINRWVASGNGVCARAWVFVNGRWANSVACISIRV
jgi:hypothetical protein